MIKIKNIFWFMILLSIIAFSNLRAQTYNIDITPTYYCACKYKIINDSSSTWRYAQAAAAATYIGRKDGTIFLNSTIDTYRTVSYFNLNGIPLGSTINSAKLVVLISPVQGCKSGAHAAIRIFPNNVAPDVQQIYETSSTSCLYYGIVYSPNTFNREYEPNTDLKNDIQDKLSSGKITLQTICETETENNTLGQVTLALKINYTVPQYTVLVKNSFTGGSIKIDDVLYNNIGSGISISKYLNQNIKVEQIDRQNILEPSNQQYYIRNFNNWKAGEENKGTASVYNHTVTQNTTITANFKKEFNLSFENSFVSLGNGGPIKVNGVSYNSPTAQFIVTQDNSITAEALYRPDVNGIDYRFDHWSDGNTSASRTISPNDHGTYIAYFKGYPKNVIFTSYGGNIMDPVQINWQNHPNSNVTQYQVWRMVSYQGVVTGPTLLATLNRPTNTYTDGEYLNTAVRFRERLQYDIRAVYSTENTLSPENWITIWGTNWYKQGKGNNNGEKIKEENLPKEFSIKNYPNPFNPTTSFEINLPGNENIELRIYDALGKEICCLVKGEIPAGKHIYNFNASNLTSGIYLYRIFSGYGIRSGKLMLMK